MGAQPWWGPGDRDRIGALSPGAVVAVPRGTRKAVREGQARAVPLPRYLVVVSFFGFVYFILCFDWNTGKSVYKVYIFELKYHICEI